VYRAIERGLARRTDRLLTVTPRVRDELLALGVGEPSQYTAVPLGFDLAPLLRAETTRGELRAELQLGDAPLVGIVARLVPIKAHEVFLAAAVRVRAARPATRFLIVGDGELRAAMEQRVAALGLGDAVRFLGWRADLDRLYADLDVVVLTSRNEGSPVALIEAMAAGRPVVATAVGGVPEVVRDRISGHLVPARRPDAMAQAICEVLADPAGARLLGLAARDAVYPKYSVSRLIRDLEALYGDLLAAKGAA
jgi:glycosyltransferase involved in cell wall biosynthesis